MSSRFCGNEGEIFIFGKRVETENVLTSMYVEN